MKYLPVIVCLARGWLLCASVRMPVLPLTPPVTVQLQGANGQCWGATYSAPSVNDTGEFKAQTD